MPSRGVRPLLDKSKGTKYHHSPNKEQGQSLHSNRESKDDEPYKHLGRAPDGHVPWLPLIGTLLLVISLLQACGADKSQQAYNRGIDALKKGDYDLAISEFTEVIRLDPKHVDARGYRGLAYGKKKDYDKAINEWTEAIKLSSNSASLYLYRGVANGLKMEYEKAIADYDEAIRLDAGYADAYSKRGRAYLDKEDYDKAIIDFNKAIEFNPSDAKAFLGRGIAYDEKNRKDEAMADYDTAIRINSRYDDAYDIRGAAFVRNGDFDKAFADFAEAMRLNPNHAQAYLNRGYAHELKGDYGKAIADYNEAIRRNPEYAGAYNGLAWLWAVCPNPSFRNGQKAVEYAKKACELSQSKKPAYLDTLAAAYAEVGNFEEAIKWEKKYLDSVLPKENLDRGRQRLALYEQRKPYREEAK